jgi:hypothetical protein
MTFSIGMQGDRSLPGTRGTGVHDLATKCTVGGPKLLLLLVWLVGMGCIPEILSGYPIYHWGTSRKTGVLCGSCPTCDAWVPHIVGMMWPPTSLPCTPGMASSVIRSFGGTRWIFLRFGAQNRHRLHRKKLTGQIHKLLFGAWSLFVLFPLPRRIRPLTSGNTCA